MSILNLLIESVQRSPDQLKKKLLKVLAKKFKGRWYDEFKEAPKDNSIDNFFGFVFRKYTPDDVIRDVLNADPTNGKYANWIISVYLDDVIPPNDILDRPEMVLVKFYEDMPKVDEYLELFDKYKDHGDMKQKDINQYKSLDELYEAVKPFKLQEDTYTVEDMLKLADDSEYEYETRSDSKWHIIYPHSEKTACIFGVNTEWCTAWGEHSMNKDYQSRQSHYEEGLIILINKKDPNDKYQVHFESQQFMDKDDHSIDLYDTFGDDPLVIEEFQMYFEQYTWDREDLSHNQIDNNRYELTMNLDDYYLDEYSSRGNTMSHYSGIEETIDFEEIDDDIKEKMLEKMEEEINDYVPYVDYDIKDKLVSDFYDNNESFQSLYANTDFVDNFDGNDIYPDTMGIIDECIREVLSNISEETSVIITKEQFLEDIFYYVLQSGDENDQVNKFITPLGELIDDDFYKKLNDELRKEFR